MTKTVYKIQMLKDGKWQDWLNGHGWDKPDAESLAKQVAKGEKCECKLVPKVLHEYRIDWYADPYDENDDGHMGYDIRWFETDDDAYNWADWNCGGFEYEVTKVEE